jgi:hypothetical protein
MWWIPRIRCPPPHFHQEAGNPPYKAVRLVINRSAHDVHCVHCVIASRCVMTRRTVPVALSRDAPRRWRRCGAATRRGGGRCCASPPHHATSYALTTSLSPRFSPPDLPVSDEGTGTCGVQEETKPAEQPESLVLGITPRNWGAHTLTHTAPLARFPTESATDSPLRRSSPAGRPCQACHPPSRPPLCLATSILACSPHPSPRLAASPHTPPWPTAHCLRSVHDSDHLECWLSGSHPHRLPAHAVPLLGLVLLEPDDHRV